MKQYAFPKSEHLKSKLLLDAVFSSNTKIYYKGIRCFYLVSKNENSTILLQCGVGVSKRIFKSAVKRNRVKRLLREAYRMEKKSFEQWVIEKQVAVHLFFSYQYKDLPKLEELKPIMNVIFTKIAAHYKS